MWRKFLFSSSQEKPFVIYGTCAWNMLLRFLYFKKRERVNFFFLPRWHANSQTTWTPHSLWFIGLIFRTSFACILLEWVWMCVFALFGPFKKPHLFRQLRIYMKSCALISFFIFTFLFGISSTCAALTQISTWSANVRIYLIIKHTLTRTHTYKYWLIKYSWQWKNKAHK